MKQIFKDIIVPIFAIVGVIQPWLLVLYKKIFKKPNLDVFESGFIEIGFNDLGPSISLMGTLNPINKDIFIKSIEVIAERCKDKLTHNFQWVAFKSEGLSYSDKKDIKFEIPHSFLISLNSPYKFNTVFHDVDTFSDMNNFVTNLNNIWFDKVEELKKESADLEVEIPGDEEFNYQQHLIKKYRDSSQYIDIYSQLNRLFYWEQGQYSFKIRIYTAYPDNIIEKQYLFELFKNDCERLRLNVMNLLEMPINRAFNLQASYYNSAYATYQNVSNN